MEKFTLRPYQQDAVNAAIDYFKQHQEPALIVLPTGAGKSLVIAELAKRARGNVLVLAHVKELVAQNQEKYCSYGLNADIFAAGLQQKQNATKVVFGSVQSVARNLDRFCQLFTLLIIDECHRISDDNNSQYHQIIQSLRRQNPKLYILGLTATPYRLGKGWVYQYHYQGMIRGDHHSFFRDCIYELSLGYMIKQQFLVEPKRLDMPIIQYDFSRLVPKNNGLFRDIDLDRELKRQQRITPQIVQQIINYTKLRRGTMIFAATVAHAEEIYSLLPINSAALINAETPVIERQTLIERFKTQQLQYLVNVAILTTGFDAPHVDLIAILRPTESISLYQQIVGRGLRLFSEKTDCLILDYAGNPHSLFTPEIGDYKPKKNSQPIQVFCPSCGFANSFWGICNGQGEVIEHYGRRCHGWLKNEAGNREQCHFRFRFKNCPQCGTEHDIAARHCHHCDLVLVDPDNMLKDALKLKNALILRCSGMVLTKGNDGKSEWLKITYYDEDGTDVSERFRLKTISQRSIFQQKFLRQHQRAPGVPFIWHTATDVISKHSFLRHPDFIVARLDGHFWHIRDKIFDYQGRYRRANELLDSL